MTPRERSDRAFDELERAFLEAMDASSEEEPLVVDVARSMGMHERYSRFWPIARRLAQKLEGDGKVAIGHWGRRWTVRRRK